jgi:hypothetical protein
LVADVGGSAPVPGSFLAGRSPEVLLPSAFRIWLATVHGCAWLILIVPLQGCSERRHLALRLVTW